MFNQDCLTNETLKSHFTDNFALAQFAINVARYLVKLGQEVNVPRILKEIQKDPNFFTSQQPLVQEEVQGMES